jgi:PAS domain S-box-containing protein
MPTQSHQRQTAFLLGLGLLLGSWLAVFALTLWQLRENALANAQATAVTHARNFEEHLTQTLQVIDLTAGSIDPTRDNRLDYAELGQRLAIRLRPAPFLRSLSLLDGKGRIVASSNADNLNLKIDVGNFFPDANREAEVLRIGMPWQGRDFSSAHPALPSAPLSPSDASFIPVLRRLSAGTENLWLLAAINPDYFINHFDQLLDSHIGHVQLLRYDGLLLLSSGPHDAPASHGVAGEVTAHLRQIEHGDFAQTLPDGQQVLTAYRASSRFPALIAVHIDRAAPLNDWARQARRLALIVLPILLALSIAGALIWRRQQRIAAQQAELDRQRRLAASVFDASTDSILITTPDADILSVNPAFESMSGYRAAEVLGRNPRLLSSGKQDSEFYRRMWETLLEHGHWQGEMVNRRKDGSLYTGWVTINAVHDDAGQLRHYISVMADITERKRHEAELLEAKERSEAAALAKTTFLATMSHEIRTPMNGVLGMTELLLLSKLTDSQRKQLELVKSSADSLLTILNEILDFSKIEAQGVAIEAVPFDPAEVINDIAGLFGARATAKSLRLTQHMHPALPRSVIGDPTRLRQILTNLVSNALKFTQAGSIVLTAAPDGEALTDGTQRLRFAVTDSGIGIPAEKQAVIFDAFSQADGSTTRHYGGTGLGLAISRRLAEAMDGDLTVASAPGNGSCFTLHIRVHVDPELAVHKQRQDSHHRHPPPSAPGPMGLRILVAEDTPTNQVVLRGILEKLGHRVTIVGDGAAAVATAKANVFDVILMDVQMPVMDGLAATREIRDSENGNPGSGGRHTPIVALTANAFSADRDACLDAGMDGFVSKPVKLTDLQMALQNIRPHA